MSNSDATCRFMGLVILNGCEIGDETLSPNVPAGATAAGHPARVISASSLMK
jgi:hypothetical protein